MKNKKFLELVPKYLLIEEAVKLNLDFPFVWKSGWKQSPICFDSSILLSIPTVRDFFIQGFNMILDQYYKEHIDLVAGISSSGLPWATLFAKEHNLPLIYVDSDNGFIRGRLKSGQKVLIVDDLISTGESSLKAIKNIRNSGGNISGILAIFEYLFPMVEDKFIQAQLPYVTLTNYLALLEVAVKEGYIQKDQLSILKDWSRDPNKWKIESKEKN